VLHVDNEEAHLVHAKSFLERADGDIRVESVATPEEAVERLAEGDFCCVVSDYRMPGFDGIELAERVREVSDVPFIIYTGRGSEEAAEAAFGVGVDDYIRKETDPSHYQVLARRIRVAVEKRRAENALKESEGKYRSFLEEGLDAVVITRNGEFLYVNQRYVEMLGYSDPSELVGRRTSEVIDPGDRERLEAIIERRQRGDLQRLSYEVRSLKKDGSSIWVWVASSGIEFEGAQAVITYARDITERKQMEEELRRSEERSRSLFELSPDVIMTGDMKGFITSANPAFTRETGYPVEDIIGKHFTLTGYLLAREIPRFMMMFRSIVRGKSVPPFEFQFKHKEGSIRWAEAHVGFQEIEGEKVGILGLIRDITERKVYETRLEALHTHALELTTAGDMDSIAEVTINAIESVFGYLWSDFNVIQDGFIFPLLVGDDELRNNMTLPLDGPGIIVRTHRTGESQLVHDVRLDDDYVHGRGSESEVWLSELAVPVKVEGEVVAVINIEDKKLQTFTDNDRKLVEVFAEHVASSISRMMHIEDIISSEEKYRNFIESSLDAIFVMDDEKYLYANRRASELLGYENPDRLIGMDAFRLVAPAFREMVTERAISRHKGEEQPTHYEIELVRRDGSLVPVEVIATNIMFEGKLVSLVINRGLTDLKQKEETLLTLNRHARDLAKCLSLDEVYEHTVRVMTETLKFPRVDVLMVDGNVLKQVTASGSIPLGVQIPLDGKGVTVKAIREKRPLIINDVSQSEDYIYADEGSSNEPFDGFPLSQSELATPIIIDDEAVGVLNVESTEVDTFTEQHRVFLELLAMHVASAIDRIRRFEELENLVEEKTRELVESERLATAGRISAMVGHDLRSPLQTIKNSLYMIKHEPEKQEEMLELIDSSVDYAGKMLEELSIRTRDDTPLRRNTDLNDLLRKAVSETSVPGKIDLDLRLSEGLDSIAVDPTQIRRVIDNLIRNAFEAMPQGGKLKVSSEVDGDDVVLTVSDNGMGIREDELENLFKPFYSTKSEGMGIGLAYCKRAIKAHGGTITVESKVRSGTTFTVRIPLKDR